MDDRIRDNSTDRAADQVARDLQRPRTTAERMQRGVDLAVELLEGCDHAGITLVRGRTLTAGPATDDIVALGDRLQDQLGEGPCLDTVRQSRTMYTADLRHDKRWETWGPQVAEKLGVRSLLSLLLYTHDRSYGALNLYSERVDGFTAEDLVVADSLATHLAVAMADGEEIEHRGVAMINRTVIGQAEGILMERLGVLPEEAFAYLRGISQRSNRKLLDVARELVSTRVLPSGVDRSIAREDAQPDPV
ncbi:GAF and ANTAR domain-containing protein [Allobranchiibius huperziae]|uniref:GAF domain-containing protein n=1 Tax=Allobranchiibius huperziae TaxID=1874116 RepID=A0A853DDW7_9MICO|nr:GAF and ANTAR domain-containing protein [Allobranchiibius huperziae]NYJ73131.1 GAF domain-containing protein [Allobranchiibius huperziae]